MHPTVDTSCSGFASAELVEVFSWLMDLPYGSLNCALQEALIISQLVQSTRDFGIKKMLDKNYICHGIVLHVGNLDLGNVGEFSGLFLFGMLGSLAEDQHLYVNCDVRKLSSVASFK